MNCLKPVGHAFDKALKAVEIAKKFEEICARDVESGAEYYAGYVEALAEKKDCAIADANHLAALNIGAVIFHKITGPEMKLGDDECREHPGVCEAVRKGQERLGVAYGMLPTAP